MDALQIEKIIVNTLLNSIPEELFVVLFVYILMGEFDHWKDKDCKKLFHSWDYSRILVPAIFSAIVSNVLRYGGASSSIVSFGTIFSLFISIVAMGDIFNNARALKWIGEVLLFLLLGSMCIAIIEFPYLYILVMGMGKSLTLINNNMLLNFLISIPMKILQFIIIFYLILYKRSLLKTRMVSMIFTSQILMILTVITFTANFSFLVIMLKVFCYDNAFGYSATEFQLIILIGIYIFPIANIFSLLGSIYFVKNRETAHKKAIYERIKTIVEEIREYPIKGSHENINWHLNGLENNLEELANSLYIEEKK